MPLSKVKKVAVGVGLGVAAATAAGYYFFGSKEAAKNRKQAVRWATDLKKDVFARVKKAKVLNEKTVKGIIKEASQAYKKVKSIDQRDLKRAVAELSDNWEVVQKEAIGAGKKVAKVATVAVKKAVASTSTKRKR